MFYLVVFAQHLFCLPELQEVFLKLPQLKNQKQGILLQATTELLPARDLYQVVPMNTLDHTKGVDVQRKYKDIRAARMFQI